MLVALGEASIKTVEDFASLASDELIFGEEAILRGFDLSEDEANEMIMAARVAAGWFTQEELAAMTAEPEPEGEETADSVDA